MHDTPNEISWSNANVDIVMPYDNETGQVSITHIPVVVTMGRGQELADMFSDDIVTYRVFPAMNGLI